MIAPTFILAILLVARVSADVNVGPVEVSQAQPVAVHHIVSNQQDSHHQVVGSPVAVEHQHQQQQQHQQMGAMQHIAKHIAQQQQQYAPQYYSAPSGLIQPVVVGEQQYGGVVQQQQQSQQQPIQKQYSAAAAAGPAVAGTISSPNEQYGQPESASIPPNYRPFGSWGLYIGGNPADGHYSSYYKALGQSVSDKQQLQQVAPASGDSIKPVGVSQASGFVSGVQPIMKQAFTYQDQAYPYESSSSYYTPADLNSGSRVAVAVAPQGGAQFGPAVYNYVEQPSVSGLSYASSAFAAPEQYASTKRSSSSSSSSSYATKSRDVQVPQAPVKGYQQQQTGYYSYAAGIPPFAYQSPVEQHQQVIAYPVPVGSQIVGSQPGVEGSYAPYGVHGFTRYAIKPTVVAAPAPAAAVHSATSVSQFPVYKQFIGYQQPMSFYGYPLSQLHYSQGSQIFGQQHGSQIESGSLSPSVVTSSVQSHPHAGVVGEQAPAHIPFAYPIEAASSEKSESTVESKPAAAPIQPVHNKPAAAAATTTTSNQ